MPVYIVLIINTNSWDPLNLRWHDLLVAYGDVTCVYTLIRDREYEKDLDVVLQRTTGIKYLYICSHRAMLTK